MTRAAEIAAKLTTAQRNLLLRTTSDRLFLPFHRDFGAMARSLAEVGAADIDWIGYSISQAIPHLALD